MTQPIQVTVWNEFRHEKQTSSFAVSTRKVSTPPSLMGLTVRGALT